MSPKYILRYWYEWNATPLWCYNDAAFKKFDFGPIPLEELPLSPQTIKRAEELTDWHDLSLNWDSPADPSLWRQDECDRFNQAAKELFETMKTELGEEYELVWEQDILIEDPDLDEYLKDPRNFRRKDDGSILEEN